MCVRSMRLPVCQPMSAPGPLSVAPAWFSQVSVHYVTSAWPRVVTTIPIVSLWMCNGPATSAPHYYSLRHIICYLSRIPSFKERYGKMSKQRKYENICSLLIKQHVWQTKHWIYIKLYKIWTNMYNIYSVQNIVQLLVSHCLNRCYCGVTSHCAVAGVITAPDIPWCTRQ